MLKLNDLAGLGRPLRQDDVEDLGKLAPGDGKY